MSREATAREIKFMERLEKLIQKMPKTMALFADGSLHAVDSQEMTNYTELEHFKPLEGTISIDGIDGGDPWK